MRTLLCLALAVLALSLAGCGGPNPYTAVNLDGDLPQLDLKRYQAEAKGVGAGHHGMATLENTNAWPLGLLAYWHRGSVMQGAAGGEPVYVVRETHGFGPLSLLFATETHATYDAEGKQLSRMGMGFVAMGHLAMWHVGENALANGGRQHSFSAHLLHHLISIHRMDGHTTYSLFTAPNPLSMDVHEGH